MANPRKALDADTAEEKKLHWYLLVFSYYSSSSHGQCSSYVGRSASWIDKKSIDEVLVSVRHEWNLTPEYQVLCSNVCYLGEMTKEQFEGTQEK